MKNLLKIITVSFVIGSVACSSPKTEEKAEIKVEVEEVNTGPEISDEITKQVLMHHLTSFGENNLDALMEDYTQESVVITPDSMFVGLEPIRNFLAGLLPAFPTEGTTLELDKMVINKEVAYIIWHATTPAVEVPLGSDTFIIEDGKIQRQTFVGIINPIEG